MKKINRAVEYFWLSMAIIMTGLSIYWSFTEGFKDSLLWFGFALFLYIYFFFRRFMRMKLESMENNKKNNQN